MEGALELRGEATGLLDDPLALRVRGAGPEEPVAWRARHRDDDGRVWRATASRAEDLAAAWGARGAEPGAIAALRSLRPVSVDVRAEIGDGRAAGRTVTRRLAADGVRLRRWRDGLTATLHLPAPGEPPCAATVLDATGDPAVAEAAALAAALLASRGALVLALFEGDAGAAAARLDAVPAAAGHEVAVVLAPAPPPGVAVQGEEAAAFAARTAAWDALLARLGARPRAAPTA